MLEEFASLLLKFLLWSNTYFYMNVWCPWDRNNQSVIFQSLFLYVRKEFIFSVEKVYKVLWDQPKLASKKLYPSRIKKIFLVDALLVRNWYGVKIISGRCLKERTVPWLVSPHKIAYLVILCQCFSYWKHSFDLKLMWTFRRVPGACIVSLAHVSAKAKRFKQSYFFCFILFWFSLVVFF